MSKYKNGGLDLYGARPFEQQQFETPGVEGIKLLVRRIDGWLVGALCNTVMLT